jgi:Flp pilus assembly protein TadD
MAGSEGTGRGRSPGQAPGEAGDPGLRRPETLSGQELSATRIEAARTIQAAQSPAGRHRLVVVVAGLALVAGSVLTLLVRERAGMAAVARALTGPGEPLFPSACVSRRAATRARVLAALAAEASGDRHGWSAVPADALERQLATGRAPGIAPEQARRHLEVVVTGCPAAAVAHNLLGAACVRLGYEDRAEAHFRRAFELEPRYLAPRHNLAVLLVGESRPADAIPWLDQVIQLAPDYPNARRARGQARLLTGDATGAAADLEIHSLQQPEDAAAFMLLAQALEAAGRHAEARMALCRASTLGLAAARGRCPDWR